MTEIEKILKIEVEKYINENPHKNDNSINGLSESMKYVKNNIPIVTKKVNEISNSYLEKNPNTNIKELTLLAKSYIELFNMSFING